MKKLIILLSLLLIPVLSDGHILLDIAELHYQNSEYYNSITECMRYQHLYPEGPLYPLSMLIMGKSYFRGGNKEKGLMLISNCYSNYSGTPAGESALFYSGLMRLESGSYHYAAKKLQEYNYVYKNGKFKEEALINLSLSYTLTENYQEAENKIKEYREIFPDGRLMKKTEDLSVAINKLKSRPKKNLYAAGIFSALLPGSGYLYTGDYTLGLFSMITNGALIYGIYNGYKKSSRFQMIFFSVIELSFYNYSIFGSIKSADEYNEGADFKKEALIGIKTDF